MRIQYPSWDQRSLEPLQPQTPIANPIRPMTGGRTSPGPTAEYSNTALTTRSPPKSPLAMFVIASPVHAGSAYCRILFVRAAIGSSKPFSGARNSRMLSTAEGSAPAWRVRQAVGCAQCRRVLAGRLDDKVAPVAPCSDNGRSSSAATNRGARTRPKPRRSSGHRTPDWRWERTSESGGEACADGDAQWRWPRR